MSSFIRTSAVLGGLLLSTAAVAGKPGSGFTYPADLNIYYCQGADTTTAGCSWVESALYADGEWEHFALNIVGVGTLEYTLIGSWELRKGGKEIVIVFEDDTITTTWEGDRVSEGCYEGTVTDTGTSSTARYWEGCIN